MDTDKKNIELLFEDLTYKIIGAAIEVHRVLGPGYLESVYEDALCYELESVNVGFQRQADLDINYLKTTGLRVGLLFNFGSCKLQKLRRIV